MSKNIAEKLNTGISPQQFIDSMEKNKDEFLEGYNSFQWDNDDDREYFESLNNRDDLRCVILASDWCKDVVRNIPAVFKALEVTGMPVEVLIMEQNTDTMDQFLTMGGRAVPIVIFTDTGGHVLGHWGPRPQHVQKYMVEFKKENPDRNAPDYEEKIKVVREQMRQAYGDNFAWFGSVVKELRDMLSSY